VSPTSTAQFFTQPRSFAEGVNAPACDPHGNLYAAHFGTQGNLGVVTPDGQGYVFVELPGAQPSGLRFDSHANLLVADAMSHSVLKVEMRSRKVTVLAHQPLMNRLHDLCITEDDVLFASDSDVDSHRDQGQVWRIDPDGSSTLVAGGLEAVYGIEVAPDEGTLYLNDGLQRRIWAFDLKAGQLSQQRLLIEFADFEVAGMRCDVEGRLYVSRPGKGCIAVVSPKGELLQEIALQGHRPSNLCFGGEDGCSIYVTAADLGAIETFRVEVPGREWVLNQRLQKGGWD
jgi:gluconolactonase